MQFGLALPQYDYSIANERPLSFETIVDYAEIARATGFDSVWLSDHLFLDLAKYGGRADREACYEPVVTLAALARRVPDVRLGALVLCEALRPASVLAKALATLDRVSGGRVDIGLGAGWYEPEYDAIGMAMPPPGVRIDRLTEAIEVVSGLLSGGSSRSRASTTGRMTRRIFRRQSSNRARVWWWEGRETGSSD